MTNDLGWCSNNLHTMVFDFNWRNVQFVSTKCDTSASQFLEKASRPTKIKWKPIINAPTRKDTSTLQSFLGLVMFYRRFTSVVSSLLQPLHQLLTEDVAWYWSAACKGAFVKVKEKIARAPILAHFDVVECDASPHGFGAYLLHEYEDGSCCPVCFV